ncbi:hypothetical protein BO70DRAFT_88091 [Aspergillus heteromorphus CBS 117.55]|uniref:Uncharacterized protein n=1 Tax=Aspergillus heteromorphus CBS 117.55 TaxID=1448321 RepID=A0A317WXS7_9EURO|nr:uncharacterized protein BO70DRAFT_88091 [Aspergillus heteromorphus CBS 117.55]PWY91214.1 hypothetical protein BO70DRAFT_88091 [Aspergillus heteromorphus CBS 117.55]
MESDDDVMTYFLCSVISCRCAKLRAAGRLQLVRCPPHRGFPCGFSFVVVSFGRDQDRDRILCALYIYCCPAIGVLGWA